MRLFISGKEWELKEATIAQTKQVNDITSVSTRQASYTNSFKVKRTATNIRNAKDLGIIGNDSSVPYSKNETYLFSDEGECFVYKGWAVFTTTDPDYFNISIYDGVIDLYKSIENLTLADLDLTDLQHDKTTANVVASFDGSKPYKYILADYNGKVLFDEDKINIDYLVPSVKASWLMEAIETKTGIELAGSYKTNIDFTNLYLTYPKGNVGDLGTTEIYNHTSLPLADNLGLIQLTDNSFQATEQITVNLVIGSTLTVIDYNDNFQVFTYFTVNGINTTESIITLNEGDILSVAYETYGEGAVSGGELFIQWIKKFNSLNIDFLDELKGLTIRDFISEILWRFGLTLFKDRYKDLYTLKGLDELTSYTTTDDWSDKFDSFVSEKYIFGSYAQENVLKYKYNDSNANYYDGSITINNYNLDDSKTIIQSKIYSPEFSRSENLGFATNIYKLWNKEPKDDGTTTYKALSNRFYMIRSKQISFSTPLKIGSESLLTSTTVTSAPVESFKGLPFVDVVLNYYQSINKLLNKSKVLTVKMNLKDTDVCNVDFSRVKFIKQLGGYFLLNKISNFVPRSKTSVELIRIDLTISTIPEPLDFTYDF